LGIPYFHKMEKLPEYLSQMNERNQFLHNHDQLLSSLLLSKQNAGTQSPNQNPEGIGNGTIESSEGVGIPGGGDAA
jgi:hypothetical protein